MPDSYTAQRYGPETEAILTKRHVTLLLGKTGLKAPSPKVLLYGRGNLRIYSTEVMLAQIKN